MQFFQLNWLSMNVLFKKQNILKGVKQLSEQKNLKI